MLNFKTICVWGLDTPSKNTQITTLNSAVLESNTLKYNEESHLKAVELVMDTYFYNAWKKYLFVFLLIFYSCEKQINNMSLIQLVDKFFNSLLCYFFRCIIVKYA